MNQKTRQQNTSDEWSKQWSIFQDNELFLFNDWIRPFSLDDFRGKKVLEGGCGGGQHTCFVAPYADTITSVDLNTVEIARARAAEFENVTFVEGDLAAIELDRQFDVVFCIGVIHHTDDPDRTFDNLYRHLRPGGTMIIWTYSAEGNALVRYGVEPVRRMFFRHLPRSVLVRLSELITLCLYPIVHTIYRLPFLSFLPYFDYFKNFREMSFRRNTLNVFDKLNAPQTKFTTRRKCDEWFSPERFEPASISITHYAGVSYSIVGTKRSQGD